MQNFIENIIRQAEYLLKEQGEFYPFATMVTNNGQIMPMIMKMDSEHPAPEDVLNGLNEKVENTLISQECRYAAVCCNIIVKSSTIATDALEICVKVGINREEKIIVMPYTHENGNVTFNGTFYPTAEKPFKPFSTN